jgi:PKD repeat protein
MKKNLLFGLLVSINSILIAQTPVADFNFTNVCLGNSTAFTDLTANAPTSWSWNFGDGSGTSTQQNPSYTYANAGNYTVTLIAQNASGYDTIPKVVTVFPSPNVDAGFDTTICMGSSASLSATGASSYSWSPSTGLSNPTIPNPTASPTTTTTYTVTGSDINGCVANDMVFITVNPLPNVNAGVDQTICMGTSTGLSASGGLMYNWTPSSGLSNSTIANPMASPTSTTTYTVTGTDANGCVANDMVKITVNPLPSVNAFGNTAICYGASAQLEATGGNFYSWTPAATLSDPNIANPIANPTSTTNYTVTGTDVNGCSANVNITVTVNPLPIINYTSHTLCETSGGFATVNLTNMDNYISGGLNMVNWYLDASYTTAIPDPSSFYTDSTIVYTQIVDINGCINSNTVEVNIPVNDIVVTPSPTDASCFGLCDGSITLTPSGGMAPFNYNWTPGGMTSNPLTGLCAGTYTYTIIDVNGCIQFDDVIINEPVPGGTINGIVYYQTNPIVSGVAELIRKDGSLPTDMTLIQTVNINPTSGEFIFFELPAANYIIKVLGDTTMYNCAATYPNLTSQWQLAQEFTIASSCFDSVYVDIDLIELPINSGNGTINGRLVESGGGLFNKAPGEPIPDIDITIDQSPGGTIMAATTTDSLGYFTVTNLPIGTYIVYADMFGYGMDISQTIDLNGVDTAYNVVLCSNDTIDMIDMCEMTITSVKKVSSTNKLSIYPNPAKDLLNIVYNGNETLHLEITDITGKKIMNQTLKTNTKIVDVAGLNKGLYIVRLYNQHDDFVQKLVIE